MLSDRDNRIFRTSRVKSATGNKKRGYAYLVTSNQYDKDIFQNLYQPIHHLIYLLRDFPVPGIHRDSSMYMQIFWR